MPTPSKDDLEVLKKFNNALGNTVASTIKYRSQVKLTEGALKFLNKRFAEGKALLDSFEKTQADFNKTLGEKGAKAAKDAIETFKKLNANIKEAGITAAETDSAYKNIGMTFALVNKEVVGASKGVGNFNTDIKEVTKAVAANSKIVEQSKLVKFIKDFSYQSGLSTKGAADYGETMVALAYKLGLPNDALLNLSDSLLTSGNYFGEQKDTIDKATLSTQAFASALGTSGDAINKQLTSMQTITGRQQLAQRLSQIGAMVGADIDVGKLMSSDPDVQREGLKEALRKFHEKSKDMSPAQKRAFSLSISRAMQGIDRQAVQTAVERGVDIDEALAKIKAAREAVADTDVRRKLLDEARRRAVTFEDRKTQFLKAQEIKVAQSQIKALTDSTNNFKAASEKLGNVVEGLDKAAKTLTIATTGVDPDKPSGGTVSDEQREAAQKAATDIATTVLDGITDSFREQINKGNFSEAMGTLFQTIVLGTLQGKPSSK